MTNKPRIISSLKRPPRGLKNAVAELIAAFSSAEAAAACCRSQPSTLSGYANTNQEDRHIPVDVVLALEEEIKRPVVTKFMAQRLGYELYKLPIAKDESPLGHRIRRIVSEGSKVFTTAADALEDGKITPEEASELVSGVNHAIAAFVDLSIGLEEILKSHKPKDVHSGLAG